MDPVGYCKICPKKCWWKEHVNIPFIWEDLVIEEEDKETKEKLEKIKSGATTTQNEVNKILKKLEKIKK